MRTVHDEWYHISLFYHFRSLRIRRENRNPYETPDFQRVDMWQGGVHPNEPYQTYNPKTSKSPEILYSQRGLESHGTLYK